MESGRLVLIIGRTGALVSELEDMIWPAGYHALVQGGSEIGLLNIDRLDANIGRLAPSLIINTIGYVSHDLADGRRAMIHARNHWSAGDLAEVAGRHDVPLIHLSSDEVFAGDRGSAYFETDHPDATAVIGQSQAAGEAEVAAHCRRYIILRTGWLFGARGHNMLRTMLSLSRRGGRVHVADDHVSGPTPIRELCAALRRIGVALMTGEFDRGGVVHFCGAPQASSFDFARQALQAAAPFQEGPDLVPMTASRFGVADIPPRRTELDCSGLKDIFGIAQPDWRRALAECVEEICRGNQEIREGYPPRNPGSTPATAFAVPGYRRLRPFGAVPDRRAG